MNKYQKLAGNTIIFAIGSFGAKLVSFILVRLYTGCLSPEEFSTADLLYQVQNILYPIVSLSMADALIRFGIDKAYDNKKIYTIAITSATAGLILLAAFSPFLNMIPGIGGYAFILYVYCYCSTFRQLASSFVRARGIVKLFAADGIFSMLTLCISNIILLVVFKLGVVGYILSTIISDVISFVLLTLIASLHKYFDFKYLNKQLFIDMVKYSAPLIPTYILWGITAASDRLFVINLVGEDVNGIYSAAHKIPTLLLFVTTIFYQAWQMSAIENKDDKGLSKFYGKVYGAYSSLLFIGAAGLIMIVKPLTSILVAKDYITAYHYTPILIIAMVFQCLCQFLSSIYSVRKKSINSLLTSLVAASVNVLLNLLLVPDFGATGAAIATASSYFACYAVRIFDARSYVKFKVSFPKLFVNMVVVCYMAFVAVKEPKLTYLQLIVLFIVMIIFNFEAILSTLRKILNRRKPAK